MRHNLFMLSSILFALLLAGAAQQSAEEPKPAEAKPAGKAAEKAKEPEEEKPVVTHHSMRVGGRELKYTATTGMMPIRDAKGDTEAHIFFMAYTLDGVSESSHRPLMFSFNGGPGSASVWLHLGAVGPKRVTMLADGEMPAPPFRLVDNEYTWLDQTDLVFIDPVGTGYSRPVKPDLGKKFWSLRGDIESVGEFIRMYLTRYERWTSPLFLVGESYGTTRAAGLSGYLIDRGVAFNGIVLVSSILNFQTADFAKGNDLPYILYLPTYAATAWYHKKLAPDLERDLHKTLKEVENWAETSYAEALAKGDRLSPGDREQVTDRLARYTGLDKRYIDDSNLRVPIFRFTKELLRDQKRTVGRLDSRFKGIDESAATATPEFDPSMAAIRPPYTSTFNNYVRGELGYKSDLEYYILGEGITGPWEWGPSGRTGFPDTSDQLRSAFAKNPYMKLYVASGHFDLATPYFATEYTLNHMGLDPSLRGNIRTGEYEAGHMVYIEAKSLEKLKREVGGFLESALK
jgi:carboxypeptidase C (cathepsin A)